MSCAQPAAMPQELASLQGGCGCWNGAARTRLFEKWSQLCLQGKMEEERFIHERHNWDWESVNDQPRDADCGKMAFNWAWKMHLHAFTCIYVKLLQWFHDYTISASNWTPFFSYLRVKSTRQNFMYSSEPSNPCPCHLRELWTQSGIALTFGTSPCRSCISHRWRPQWSLEMAWNSYNGPYPQRQPDVICCPASKSCIFIPSQHSSTKTHPLQPHSWACRSEVLEKTGLGRISDRNCNGHCIIISSFHSASLAFQPIQGFSAVTNHQMHLGWIRWRFLVKMTPKAMTIMTDLALSQMMLRIQNTTEENI